jgi:hypothetical protein
MTMRRALSLLAMLPLVAAAARAQSLARRIDAVREGTVRMSFASRPGVCGDGRDMVRSGQAFIVFPSMFSYGRSEMSVCFTGPVRVAIGRSDGETVSLRVHVGGRWSDGDDITDLGTVAAPEAARYLLDEATRLRGGNAEYALGAAVFADSVRLWRDLVPFVRDESLKRDLRNRAVFFIATYDEPGAAEAVRDLAADERLDDDVRGAAIIAIGRDDMSDADVAWLKRLYASASRKIRDNIFLAVSRSDSPRAAAWLTEVTTNEKENEETRKQAMFWLGQGRAPTSALVRLYDRLQGSRSSALRSHYAFVLSQRHDDESLDKLIDVARRDADRDVRKQALFWLGQSKDPRAAAFLRDLVLR